ncbi:hypothetical protein HGRIS_004951 [Hohenbuehelia grisea]|uniref:Protein kinase domain-containing protein n=1 Tax=Hohenbuehelia grisea TaxID=104357 RepID=A0ABR3JEB8_9AGAR
MATDVSDRLQNLRACMDRGGGQAVLYLATLKTDGGEDQEVALRVYGERDVHFAAAARKYLEAAFPRWSLVDHPNLAPILGVVVKKRFFLPPIVVPYYTRGTLWSHIVRQRKTSLSQDDISERLLWCLEIARAIEYLHTLDPPIIHSDLRCANIFLDNDGHVRVSEYGLMATLPADAPEHIWAPRSAGHALYRWMAPESMTTKLSPNRVDPPTGYSLATDVWAFGMTVLEIFTARSPYAQDVTDKDGTHPQAKGDIEVYKLIPAGVLPPLTGFLGDTPAMRNLLLRCWSRNPKKRPSMSEVRRALERLNGIEPADHDPPPAVESYLLAIFRTVISGSYAKLRDMFGFFYRLFRWPV